MSVGETVGKSLDLLLECQRFEKGQVGSIVANNAFGVDNEESCDEQRQTLDDNVGQIDATTDSLGSRFVNVDTECNGAAYTRANRSDHPLLGNELILVKTRKLDIWIL